MKTAQAQWIEIPVEECGETLVSGSQFYSFISTLRDETVTVETGEKCKIYGKSASMELPLMDESLPPLELDFADGIELNKSDLDMVLSKTSIFAEKICKKSCI